MGSDLQVIAGLQLPIHHWIFLHTHEGRIVVSFGIAITTLEDIFGTFILFGTRN